MLAALAVGALRTVPAAAVALGSSLALLALAHPPFRWARDRLLVIATKCPVHKTLKAQDVRVNDELELFGD